MSSRDIAGKCGLYCGACPFYLGTKDPNYKEEFKQENGQWEEDWYCLGCGNLDEKSWGNQCLITQCAVSKSVMYCHTCDEYPCEKLIAFSQDNYPHHHTVISGSNRMKEIGCDAWLEEQEKRWACTVCKKPFGWYAKTCMSCGNKVFNSVEEDKETSKNKEPKNE